MLTAWLVITKQEYSCRQDLLGMSPSPYKMSIANIAKGGCIMADNCNAAHKFQRFLIETITEISKNEGMTSNQINIFEAGKLYNILLNDLKM